jgi:hypothetical protein
MIVPISESYSENQQIPYLEATPATEKKVYGVIALMEVGLHPFRGDTKYRIREYRLIPMSAKDYDVALGPFVCNFQWLSRTWYGARHEDLSVLEQEIPRFASKYLWKSKFSKEAKYFLEKCVISGLKTLQGTYKHDKAIYGQIEDWMIFINKAVEAPDKNALILRIKRSDLFVKDFFKTACELLLHYDSVFGLSIRKILTVKVLRNINIIFTQIISGDVEKIKDVEEKINELHQKYLKCVKNATQESFPRLNSCRRIKKSQSMPNLLKNEPLEMQKIEPLNDSTDWQEVDQVSH